MQAPAINTSWLDDTPPPKDNKDAKKAGVRKKKSKKKTAPSDIPVIKSPIEMNEIKLFKREAASNGTEPLSAEEKSKSAAKL